MPFISNIYFKFKKKSVQLQKLITDIIGNWNFTNPRSLNPTNPKCGFGFSVCIFISAFSFFFFLFFFHSRVSGRQNLLFTTVAALFTHCSWDHSHFIQKKNVKNGSHGTIHTFKNYFTTVYSVFSSSKNKFNPNGP